MSILAFSSRFLLRILVILAPLNLVMIAGGLMLGWERASMENGLIENTQLAVLAISMVAGVIAARASADLLRMVMAGWVALMLLLIQREFDFSMLGHDSWLYTLRSMDVRLSYWAPIAALLIVWALRFVPQIARAVAALRWRHLWPALLTGVLVFISMKMEDAVKTGQHGGRADLLVFGEELFELNAYCVIASVAIAIAARLRRPVSHSQAEARNHLSPLA